MRDGNGHPRDGTSRAKSSAGPAGAPSPAVVLRPAAPEKAPAITEVLASSDDGTSAPEKATRPPAAWENFAPPAERPPSALRRLGRGTTAWLSRFLGHEWTLAAIGGLVLSLLLNLALPYVVAGGVFADPTRTLPQDVWDPSLVAYLIAWDGHALIHDPANLWHLNGFYPSPYGLAYTDSLLGYAPLAVVGSGMELAILRYNVIFVLAQALAFVGAYALARQLGAYRLGALVAGVAFAVAPWRLAQAGHLQVISTGGMALALAMLARGHGVRWRHRHPPDGGAVDTPATPYSPDAPTTGSEGTPGGDRAHPDGNHPDGNHPDGDRPRLRPGWALAGWLVAAWQLSIGFGIGLVFAYVLLGVSVIGALWWMVRRRWPGWRLLLADGVGGMVFAGVALLLAQPYLSVLRLYPYARRDADWVAIYSPPPRGFLTAPAESLIWGAAHAGARAQLSLPGEMALLPGLALCAFAVAGLFFSVWRLPVRLALAAGVAVTVVLGLGTNGPARGNAGYLALLDLPGFEGLRTPGRLVVWTTLLLALLAAGGVSALLDRSTEVAVRRRGVPHPSTLGRLALLIPAVLILVEGLGTTPRAAVPPAPPVLSAVAAPYLVLPTDQVRDMHVLLWSTDRFAETVNGGSGVVPAEQQRTREVVATFPDRASVEYLRGLGVRTVVVLPDRAVGTAWEAVADRPVDELGISRQVTGAAIVFDLSP